MKEKEQDDPLKIYIYIYITKSVRKIISKRIFEQKWLSTQKLTKFLAKD